MRFFDTEYVSEYTRWMREMQESHPEWDILQREGRAIWWEKPQEALPDGVSPLGKEA
jgi:hypothetical protein